MDAQLITSLFQHTLDPSPDTRAQAEAQLQEFSRCPGFLPVILQMVMSSDIHISIRQAAVIYLKNMTGKFWRDRDINQIHGEQLFVIPDADKSFIRDKIVESVIEASELIRIQLTVSVYEILSCDFPEKWPDICHKLNTYLTSDIRSTWLGALLVLYQIVKKYEYKKQEDRGPIDSVMEVFLPILHSRCTSLVKEDTADSYLLLTIVFKIFRSLIQLHLPLNLINQNNFPQWMGLFKVVLEKPVPSDVQVDDDERPQLSWWKAKKWALTIIFKVFERYGCPGSEEKIYAEFADFYDKNYSEQITGIMLKILNQHRSKEYIAPRVLQQAINYLAQGVHNARSWKVVKPHFSELFKEILFPLMCHSDEDEALWLDDPQEYIRVKYDVFEDFLYFSPHAAAKLYLKEAVKKRKNVIQIVIEFTMQVFNMDASTRDPKFKDGALHVVGSLAETLQKKKAYKNHMESVLSAHVLPEFHSPHGFLRARACWVVQQFAIIGFKDDNVLAQTIQSILQCLTDKDLPVQVEAGIAIRQIVDKQEEKANDMLRPHVRELVQQILRILRESENDELTGTVSILVQNFAEEVSSISVELVKTLAETFNSLVESEEDYDSKSVTAMGILETIEIVVGELDGSPEIMSQLELQVISLIQGVLQKELMEYYEEVFSLITECTAIQISNTMWNMLFLLYETFHRDASDYFTEMMPCLHNYVTVDPEAFLARPKYCEAIFNMCNKMLIEYSGEGAQCQAAKLLEVCVLQYRGTFDQWLPAFISLCLERLTLELKTSELRVMLLQVIIASIISNPVLVISHLSHLQNSTSQQNMFTQFLSQWLSDTDCFLGMHDRKVYIFGICVLLALPADNRPPVIEEFAPQFVPALLLVFNGLAHMYDKMAKDVEDEEDDIDDDNDNELNDSDDEYDEEGQQYVESLLKKEGQKVFDFDDDDDDDVWANELDMFTTPIDDTPYVDEYITFKSTFEALQSNDPRLFTLLTQSLTDEQKVNVQGIINEGIKNAHKLESRKLDAQGGYNFESAELPRNIEFGGSLS
ncbi:importin-7 isoform X1 [Hydra vulgaris]|uniref:Importin-7 n=1 Tax=Hydra vulgaris TaxID=6087 RepID=T2MHS3_HYDVU|nr:importin-7 [Hydra vulgaris]